METCWIAGLFVALTEFSITDLIDVRGPVIHQIAAPGESMASEYDGVIIVGQYIFDLFVERPTRDLHRLSRECMDALSADVASSDSVPAWHVKSKIVRTRLQVAIDITAAECCIGFSDGCFQRMPHASQSNNKIRGGR